MKTLNRIDGIRISGLAFALGMAACSPVAAGSANAPTSAQSDAALAVHPVSGLKVVPLTVKTASGVHRFKVELAATADEQAKGLMFRTAMGADEGMIFPMDPPRRASFWMKNTVISLDLVFVGPDHKVLNVAANAVPCDPTPLSAIGLTGSVLELNAGRAAEIGIKPGDEVNW
ncbi:DUF192 domain-containing protein [Novosphingobium sp. Chol11]|uniref:DUF192 domain-containing protein n=1 Tax=Novosphingobium sp. Chol11 TaxID=1385763 RepID=UPI002600A18A|nr:DUF192 domain-containing protein [Novosphingobium sp. Chol11]